MKIRIPPSIKKGDTIAITAPSFGCVKEPYSSRFAFAQKKFEERGYKIITGDTVFKNDGKGIATDPRTAYRELEEYYCSNETSAIISAGGGEMMCETVGFIDFDRIASAKPKWFMGYSDNTNFIFPLVTICRTASIYGPSITGFGKKWERTELDSITLLEGKLTETSGFEKYQLPENDSTSSENLENLVYNLTEPKILKLFPETDEVKGSGILLGGCLDVLANLCGTRLDRMKDFNHEVDSIIWVLESCDGNPAEIRRQMWHLKNANWFEKASLFVIGRPLASLGSEMMGINQYNAVTDILSDFGLPIIMDADIGHVDPVMPLVMGSQAEVIACKNNLTIKYTEPFSPPTT